MVAIDPTGRMPGRGAYLCASAECWDLALRKRTLAHALGVAIPDHVVAALTTTMGTPATTTHATATHRANGADPEPDDNEGGAHGPK